VKESMKIDSVYQSLIRKALITKDDEKLTLIGKDLLEFMDVKSTGRIVKRKPATNRF